MPPTPTPPQFCPPLLKPALEGWLQNGCADRANARSDGSFRAPAIKALLLISGVGVGEGGEDAKTKPFAQAQRLSKTLAFCSGVSVERLADTSRRTASLSGDTVFRRGKRKPVVSAAHHEAGRERGVSTRETLQQRETRCGCGKIDVIGTVTGKGHRLAHQQQ